MDATDYLRALAKKAQLPLLPPGASSQARYDHLRGFQRQAESIMGMLPKPSVYGPPGDVLAAADAFRRAFTDQASSFLSIANAGKNLIASAGTGQFLAFLWAAYFGAQRGMDVHQPAFQQASLQSGALSAQLLDYDYQLRLGVFYMVIQGAQSGMLDPLFKMKAEGLGEPIVLSTGVIVLTIIVVALIAATILGLYWIYEHNKLIEDTCKKPDAVSQQLCRDLAMQQGAAIADGLKKLSEAPGDIIGALKWIGIAYVAVMLAPPLIAALSSAASSRRATA